MKQNLLSLILFFIAITVSAQNVIYDFDSKIEVKKTEKQVESPYSMFGDNTAVLQTKHEEEKDHTLKIPIVKNNHQEGLFKLDFQSGIVSVYDNKDNLLFQEQLMKENSARFTTMDPLAEKYYSISPYAYVANNPMNATDPTGMWIQYSDSTGQYRYNNGQWEQYQTSGQHAGQYTAYAAAAGSFMAGVLGGLNALNRNVTGNKLLGFFANDENTATIISAAGNSRGDVNLADIEDSSIGQIWLSSTFQGSPIPTERGIQTSPFWLDMGHELAHRQDVLKNGGVQARAEWLTNPDTGDKIPASEKYATHMENLMRADAGLSLRTHYVKQGSGGWDDSRILNVGTRVNKFNGTTYRSTPRILIPRSLFPSSR